MIDFIFAVRSFQKTVGGQALRFLHTQHGREGALFCPPPHRRG